MIDTEAKTKKVLNDATMIMGTPVYETDIEAARRLLLPGTYDTPHGSMREETAASIVATKGEMFVCCGSGKFADNKNANLLFDLAEALIAA